MMIIFSALKTNAANKKALKGDSKKNRSFAQGQGARQKTQHTSCM